MKARNPAARPCGGVSNAPSHRTLNEFVTSVTKHAGHPAKIVKNVA